MKEPTMTKDTANDNPTTIHEDVLSSIFSSNRGKPLASREQSVKAMRTLMGQAAKENDIDDTSRKDGTCSRPPISNVHGCGPLLLSDLPQSARRPGVCVGIDEAGRGSVLGPMIYGAAFWNASLDDNYDTTTSSSTSSSKTSKSTIPKGFNDSKQLTEEMRATLLEQLMACEDIGWCARILEASEISRNMLRAGAPYNLNQMSHDAAMEMIDAIQGAGVPIQTCYIDTVGNPEYYKRKLQLRFPNLDFVVESKADAKYATCSAASVGKTC
jgi:ribonuclease HII